MSRLPAPLRPAEFNLLAPPEPVGSWQPWPVEPAWIDRVEIRWPGDDWPANEKIVIIEEELPDAPPQIILWRETGGLLDMWA